MATFAAIDFETANNSRNSACAVGVVLVSSGRIVKREKFLIRPPTPHFTNTRFHGLRWGDVHKAPSFGVVWPRIRKHLDQCDFVAAHNAPFERSVVNGCCTTARLRIPVVRFVCTIKLAREWLDIYPTKLPNVCEALGISLDHHNPLSDAEACARIVLAARKAGWSLRG